MITIDQTLRNNNRYRLLVARATWLLHAMKPGEQMTLNQEGWGTEYDVAKKWPKHFRIVREPVQDDYAIIERL